MAESKHSIFIPIHKIDEERRCVYGIATAESPDKQGEICDYDTSKPYYEKWSSDIEKASDGKSKGNLRVMHTNKVAGTIPQIVFNDDNKQIEICAKVIDNDEWKMVLAGGYTGFSQGGSYAKKWKDGEFTRYTSNPCEISLVDNPCLSSATFEVVKADGSVELRKFQNLEQNKMSKVTDKEVVKSEVVQGWKANDGSFHISKADAIAHNADFEKKSDESTTEDDMKDNDDVDGESQGEGEIEKGEFLDKIFNDARNITNQISLNPTHTGITSNAQKTSNLSSNMVVVNMERFPTGSEAYKTLSSLFLEKGVVVIDSNSIFSKKGGISSHADFIGITSPAFSILSGTNNATTPTFSSSISSFSGKELVKRFNGVADATRPIGFIIDGNPSDNSIGFVDISISPESLVVKSAKTESFIANNVFASFNSAFSIGNVFHKREFTIEEREKLAETGAAMEDGSFPIKTKEDLKNAIHAYGRAKDKIKAKAHIISRAKALGESSSLPEGWDGSEKSNTPYDIRKFMGNEAFDVSCALDALISIQFLCERECMEGEGGSQLEDLMMVIDRLKSFIASEIKENTGEGMENAMEMADSGDLEKAGAKISAKSKSTLDMMYKSAKDHMDTMEKCMKAMGTVDESSSDDEGTPSAGGITDNVDGRVNVDTTQKTTEAEELQKRLEDKASTEALQKMVDTVVEMQKRIDLLESQPAADSKGIRLVLKDHGSEIGNGSVEADVSSILKNYAKESPMVQAQRLIKAIQSQK